MGRDPLSSAGRTALGQRGGRLGAGVTGRWQGTLRQVRARPRAGRGPRQGVATLSPRRVADRGASRQNATRLRPPALNPPPRPLVGSWLLLSLRTPALHRGSCRGRKHRSEAPPLLPKEPIRTQSPGARALLPFALRSLLHTPALSWVVSESPRRSRVSLASSATPVQPPTRTTRVAPYIRPLLCNRMWRRFRKTKNEGES